ncbi:MAG: lamin tail domain-containing protein [Bacilli bacterium]|jgi:hypothetical protein
MKKLIRRLLGPLTILSLAVGVGLSISKTNVAVKAAEAVIYSTGFESAEGFTSGNVYNDENVNYSGATGQQWGTVYGTPTTTDKITGSQSLQMRKYTPASSPNGYTFTNFDLTKVTKVDFKAKGTNGLNVELVYSTDSGATWVGNQTFTLSTTAAEYSYTVSTTGEFNNVRIRFNLTYGTAPASTSRLTIDDVNVYGKVPSVTSLVSSGTLSKTTYYEGETFDPTGLIFTAYYDNGTNKVVTNDVTFTPSVLTTGTVSVTAKYTENEVNVTTTITGITVQANPVISIAVKTLPTNTTFSLGSTFNSDGLVISATRQSGLISDVTSGFTLSTPNMMQLGEQLVSVTYETKDTTYTINLTNAGAQVKGATTSSDLFFSEYVEGVTGNNKVLEIYNGTGAAVNLTGYSVKLFPNGASTTTNVENLTGTLPNGSTFVIANPGSDIEVLSVAAMTSTVTYFNGDDAIGLYKNDVLIDVIGKIGEQKNWSGTGANGVAGSTKDQTLVRSKTSFQPRTVFEFSEWDVYPADTFTYLGSHQVTPLTEGITAEEQALAFRNYVLTGVGNGIKDRESTCFLALAELEAEYDLMAVEAKNIFETATGTEWDNARIRYQYLKAWVAANTPSPSRHTETSVNTISSALIIGVIGLSALLGFYFLQKKKKLA